MKKRRARFESEERDRVCEIEIERREKIVLKRQKKRDKLRKRLKKRDTETHRYTKRETLPMHQ